MTQFFAVLVRDYLAEETAGARAPGLPTAAQCEITVGTPVEEKTRPVITVAAVERKGGRGGRRELTVMAFLKVWLVGGDAQAATMGGKRIKHEQACEWLKGLDDRLRDRASFSAWVAALPEERRAGWSLLKMTHQGEMPTAKEEDNDFSYPVAVDFTVALFDAV